LIILIIFYFIGDIVRYIYSRIRPRIIPEVDFSEMEKIARNRMNTMGNVVEVTEDESNIENTEDESTNDEDLEEYESSDVGE
jgi:hypothetical protein